MIMTLSWTLHFIRQAIFKWYSLVNWNSFLSSAFRAFSKRPKHFTTKVTLKCHWSSTTEVINCDQSCKNFDLAFKKLKKQLIIVWGVSQLMLFFLDLKLLMLNPLGNLWNLNLSSARNLAGLLKRSAPLSSLLSLLTLALLTTPLNPLDLSGKGLAKRLTNQNPSQNKVFKHFFLL